MYKRRKLLGKNALKKAIALYQEKKIPISNIVKLLELDMHYKTVFDIIKAEVAGCQQATQPQWLEDEPDIQEAPVGWRLNGGLPMGRWIHNEKRTTIH